MRTAEEIVISADCDEECYEGHTSECMEEAVRKAQRESKEYWLEVAAKDCEDGCDPEMDPQRHLWLFRAAQSIRALIRTNTDKP